MPQTTKPPTAKNTSDPHSPRRQQRKHTDKSGAGVPNSLLFRLPEGVVGRRDQLDQRALRLLVNRSLRRLALRLVDVKDPELVGRVRFLRWRGAPESGENRRIAAR